MSIIKKTLLAVGSALLLAPAAASANQNNQSGVAQIAESMARPAQNQIIRIAFERPAVIIIGSQQPNNSSVVRPNNSSVVRPIGNSSVVRPINNSSVVRPNNSSVVRPINNSSVVRPANNSSVVRPFQSGVKVGG
ncbi:MAG: hypothetical protein IT371_31195 [Deltaproteobacteria bacterium]|nr:hypothetical protein [Deltaproteobacteria bacterium]